MPEFFCAVRVKTQFAGKTLDQIIDVTPAELIDGMIDGDHDFCNFLDMEPTLVDEHRKAYMAKAKHILNTKIEQDLEGITDLHGITVEFEFEPSHTDEVFAIGCWEHVCELLNKRIEDITGVTHQSCT